MLSFGYALWHDLGYCPQNKWGNICNFTKKKQEGTQRFQCFALVLCVFAVDKVKLLLDEPKDYLTSDYSCHRVLRVVLPEVWIESFLLQGHRVGRW